MGIVNSGALPLGEFLVFAGAVFHMLNGIRLGVTELGFMLRKPERPIYPYTYAAGKQKPLVWLVLLLTAIIVAYGGYEFLYRCRTLNWRNIKMRESRLWMLHLICGGVM